MRIFTILRKVRSWCLSPRGVNSQIQCCLYFYTKLHCSRYIPLNIHYLTSSLEDHDDLESRENIMARRCARCTKEFTIIPFRSSAPHFICVTCRPIILKNVITLFFTNIIMGLECCWIWPVFVAYQVYSLRSE